MWGAFLQKCGKKIGNMTEKILHIVMFEAMILILQVVMTSLCDTLYIR